MDKLELELTPIEELVEEFMGRTESCVICWEPLKPDSDGCDVKSAWKAVKGTDAIGLCEVVKSIIIDSIRIREDEDDE